MSELGLLSAELEAPVRKLVLPLLSLADLSQLERVCKDARSLVQGAPDKVKGRAALRCNPWLRPVPTDWPSATAAVQRHAACTNRISKGRPLEVADWDVAISVRQSCRDHDQQQHTLVQLSPSGRLLAYSYHCSAIMIQEQTTGQCKALDVGKQLCVLDYCWHPNEQQVSLLCQMQAVPTSLRLAVYCCISGTCQTHFEVARPGLRDSHSNFWSPLRQAHLHAQRRSCRGPCHM